MLLISYTQQHALHLYWCGKPLISSTQDENCGNKSGRNQFIKLCFARLFDLSLNLKKNTLSLLRSLLIGQ